MIFYREKSGTVVAIDRGCRWYDTHANGGRGGWLVDGYAGLWERPNSPCASTPVSEQYLRRECEKITEDEARELHPALFEYLGD